MFVLSFGFAMLVLGYLIWLWVVVCRMLVNYYDKNKLGYSIIARRCRFRLCFDACIL